MPALLANRPATPQHATIQYTNLYEILTMLQEGTSATDDSTIVATVQRLVQSGRLQFLRPEYVATLWADIEKDTMQGRQHADAV